MLKTFIFAEDRRKLREKAAELLANPSSEKFVMDSANVVTRLLDTIDHFEKSNYKLAQTNTELELEMEERAENALTTITELGDKNIDLKAKNQALEAYVTVVEGVRDSTLKSLDLAHIEMLDLLEEDFEKNPLITDTRPPLDDVHYLMKHIQAVRARVVVLEEKRELKGVNDSLGRAWKEIHAITDRLDARKSLRKKPAVKKSPKQPGVILPTKPNPEKKRSHKKK